MSICCPKCQKDDKILKVTSIVKNGISHYDFSGPTTGVAFVGGKFGTAVGYQNLKGSIGTDLALILRPPSRPKKKGIHLVSLLFIISTLAAFYFLSIVINYIFQNPDFELDVFLPGFLVTIFSSFCAFALYRWGLLTVSKFNKEQHPTDLRKWHSQMEIYDRLYYCYQDDVVFDPDNNRYVSIKVWGDILKQNT